MSRSTDEWIASSDDASIPPRVRLRVLLRYEGKCQCGCNRIPKIRPGEDWQCDHIIAIVNGGEHRENNLQPLLTEHHKTKTRQDVKEKSATYHKQLKHYGVKAKPKGRAMPGTKRSGWKHKFGNGGWERRTVND